MKIISIYREKYQSLNNGVKASLWYTICNVLQKGAVLLTTPIFTRLLSQSQYGKFTIFQSWYGIISIFATLNLFQSVYTRGLVNNPKNEDNYTSSLLTLTTTITLVVGVVYLLGISFWTNALELSPKLMLFMFIQLFATTPVEFWAAKQRVHFRYKQYMVVVLLTTFISIGLGILLVLNSDAKVEARIAGDTIAKLLFGGFIFFVLVHQGHVLYSKKYWKEALLFNIPLLPHFLSTLVLNQADRVMIGKMIGNSQAAIYSIAYTIATMMILVVNALNSTAMPDIYRNLRDKKYHLIVKQSKGLFVLVAVMSVLAMCFGPEVVLLFAGKSYMDAVALIPPISASVFFIFVYSMYSTIEFYHAKTIMIAVISVICAVVNIGLNFAFLPIFGYYAAGYTTLFSYILFAILHYWMHNKILDEFDNGNQVFDNKGVLGISLVLLIFTVLMLLVYSYTILRYIILLLVLISFVAVAVKMRKV